MSQIITRMHLDHYESKRSGCDECDRNGPYKATSVTRYVITYLNRDEIRTIVGAAQGRNTWATQEGAALRLGQLISNTDAETLTWLFGDVANLEVRACE